MKTDDVAIAFWVWLLLCVLHKAGCNTLATTERIYCEIRNDCELNCSAAYNSSTVVWKKNDNDIILDIKSRRNKNPAKYTETENGRKLKIHNTTENDKGKFACEVTDTGFWIHYVMVELLDITVQNADENGQITATVGEEIPLVCNVSASAEYGTSNMTLNWIGEEVLPGQEKRSNNIVTYMHNFTAIKTHHLRKYTCRLSILGSTRTFDRFVHLNIRYPSGVSIVDYHNGTLQCNASGLPGKYSYNVWEHRSLFGEHIRFLKGTADGYINVTSNGSNPSYQNNGVYKCSATNRVHDENKELYQHGEQRVIFEEKPEYVTEARQIIYGDVGERVILSVAFFSFPDVTDVYWLKSAGLKVVTSEKYYQINNHFNISLKIYESIVTIEGYNSSLAINDIQKGDDCHYTVVVINPRGETRCTVQLVLNDTNPFIIPVVVGSVAAVVILLAVMCIVLWKCKKASKSDTTCDEDRYEKTEYKKKHKPEDIYEEVVLNLNSEGKRFEFVSTDNLL